MADIVIAHIAGMDALARGLRAAAALAEDGRLAELVAARYASFNSGIGAKIHSEQARAGRARAAPRGCAPWGCDAPPGPPGLPVAWRGECTPPLAAVLRGQTTGVSPVRWAGAIGRAGLHRAGGLRGAGGMGAGARR